MFQISDLKCEFATNPLGIDTRQPRFSWLATHPERGQAPSAYQILVGLTPENLASDKGDLWDSGKTAVGVSPLVEYGGAPLSSRQRGYWKVRLWDASGQPSLYSDSAWFELALLERSDWHAEWIGFPAGRNGKALYFRNDFRLDKPIQSARAYASGLGWYELHLNGQKVGSRVLEPAQTEFSQRVLYSTYDITSYLQTGINAVGAIVGNGWYGAPKVLIQVEVTFTDGTQTQFVTGRHGSAAPWWAVCDGPIVENSVYDGEVYDARRELTGWDVVGGAVIPSPNFDVWAGANIVEPPGGKLVAQTLEPIEVIDTLRPKTKNQPKPGVYVFDTEQNLAGWAVLTVSGPRGTAVTLRFAESLYEDGTVNQENLRSAKATDIYILKGEGVEIWEPRFTYHGFRYVQVDGFPGEPTFDSIQVRVVRTAADIAGRFESANALVNQIDQAVFWTETSNLHGVPTDCPQRNERMGWLNDMAARSEELVHNFNVSRLLPKWLNDIADAQDPDTGAISDTAPFHWGSRPADPVSVCYLLIPWLLYQHYGDRRTLEDQYAGMKGWVDYLTSRAPDSIVEYSYYGDWAPPIAEGLAGSMGSSAVALRTPGTLISTAHYYYAAMLFVRIATVLGRDADAAEYQQLAERIYDSFNRHFWDEASGGYGSNNQASNVAALYMRLVPDERKTRVRANIIRDILDHDTHVTTGNLCSKYILEILTESGHGDLAYKLVTQTTYPSWGYMMEHGATTIWERWEQATGAGMNSHNHPMYASVGAWFYRALAGIQLQPDAVGFSRFAIRPIVPEELSSARATLKTVRGEVESAWEASGSGLSLNVRIPAGSQAEVRLPKSRGANQRLSEGGKPIQPTNGILSVQEDAQAFVVTVGSGAYRFTVETQ